MTQERPGNGSSRSTNGYPSDPSFLTTAQLLREVFTLRELLEARLDGLADKVETRLDAMDKAIALIQEVSSRKPSEADVKVGNLQALMQEKFTSIETQFSERDTRTADVADLNKLAIGAALQTQKEAAGKAEDTFTKQIEKQGDLIETKTTALANEIRANLQALSERANNNKERLDRIEGQVAGVVAAKTDLIATKTETRAESAASSQLLFGALGIVVGLVGAVALFFSQ